MEAMNIVRGVADLLRKSPPPAAPGGASESESAPASSSGGGGACSFPAADLDDAPTPRVVFSKKTSNELVHPRVLVH